MTTRRWIRWMAVMSTSVAVLTGSAMMARAADDSSSAAANDSLQAADVTSDSLISLAPAAAASNPDKWRFTIPIGVYYFGMSGPVGMGDRSLDINLDAGDVRDATDKAAGFAFDFGKGKWTGLTLATYIKFAGDPRTIVQAITAEPALEETVVQFGVAYQAVVVDPGPQMFVFEPLVGGRWSQIKSTINLTTAEGSASNSHDITWEDVYLGFRIMKSFTPRLGLKFYGDYGRGVSGNTKPSWNADASIGWRFPFDAWGLTVGVGYKIGAVEYENTGDNPYHQDLTMKGPTLGVAFSW